MHRSLFYFRTRPLTHVFAVYMDNRTHERKGDVQDVGPQRQSDDRLGQSLLHLPE